MALGSRHTHTMRSIVRDMCGNVPVAIPRMCARRRAGLYARQRITKYSQGIEFLSGSSYAYLSHRRHHRPPLQTSMNSPKNYKREPSCIFVQNKSIKRDHNRNEFYIFCELVLYSVFPLIQTRTERIASLCVSLPLFIWTLTVQLFSRCEP